MTRDKDIIYINGDSFAEGCDMADHLYPFFKKYHSLHEIITEDRNTRAADQLSAINQKLNFNADPNNKGLIEEIIQFEIDNRWSSKLAEYLGKPVYNLSSHGGSSMYAIMHRTMADLHILKKQGHTITDVIIQLTSPGRYSFFNKTKDYEEPRHKQNDYYYNIKTFNAASNPEMAKLIMTHEPFFMIGYRWLHEVYLLKHAIASITDARLILVDSLFYRKSDSGLKPYQFPNWSDKQASDDYLINFKKQLDDEVELSMLDCTDLNEPETLTDGMHFTAKVHDRFAKKIAEKYFNE